MADKQKKLITLESRGINPDEFSLEEVHSKMASVWNIVDRLETEKKEYLKGRNERIRHYKKIHNNLVEAANSESEEILVEEYEAEWRDLVDTAIANG